LNPDSNGEFIDSNVRSFCEKNILLFQSFDIVVSSNLDYQTNLFLNELVDRFDQRLVVVKNYGLIGYMRLYENYHGNMHLKLHDKPVVDLRIVKPWKELKVIIN
jgi:amyloid beta precursor protein binding protein 1